MRRSAPTFQAEIRGDNFIGRSRCPRFTIRQMVGAEQPNRAITTGSLTLAASGRLSKYRRESGINGSAAWFGLASITVAAFAMTILSASLGNIVPLREPNVRRNHHTLVRAFLDKLISDRMAPSLGVVDRTLDRNLNNLPAAALLARWLMGLDDAS